MRALAAFLPEVAKPDFVAGRWVEPDKTSDGAITLPWVEYDGHVEALVATAYRHGLVLSDFDWSRWAQTSAARALRDDPAALALAEPDHLAKLLTVLIRSDRFVEGALKSAFDSGLVLSIIRRAAEIAGRANPATTLE